MIKVREVEDKDLLPLTEFLPGGFPHTTKEFWSARFVMWWTQNPAYTPQIPRGWVLENDGVLAGFIGNIPIKYHIGGEVRIAAASSSWFVDPAVRGMSSIRLFNEFLKQKNVVLFLFKAEEEQLMQLLTRYKFEEYILPKSQKEYVCILDRKNFAFNFSKFIFNKKVPKISELPELYKRAGLLIFGYLFPKSSVRMNNHPDEAYTSSLCTSCDDSFFEIHEHSLNRCDVVVSHDTRTLNWLYFSKARWFKRLVIQCRRSRDNYLAGYMVFDFERNKMTDPGNMRLMEMRIADPDPRVLPSLLGFAIEMGKQNNAALLVLWADNTETDQYFKNTLSLRRVVQHYRYIRYPDVPDSEKTKHGNACPSLIYPPQ